VQITAPPKLAAGIEAALRRLPEVRKLYTISGVYVLVANVVTDSVDAMERFLTRSVRSMAWIAPCRRSSSRRASTAKA